MRNRRRLAIAVLLMAAVATFFLPPVYWRVTGWVKGEAFYDGRPTSWWSAELRGCQLWIPGGDLPASRMRNPSNWEEWWARISGNYDAYSVSGLPDFDHNPAAVPLLEELLHDPDFGTGYIAASALGQIGPAAKPAFASLLQYRNSLYRDLPEDEELRMLDPKFEFIYGTERALFNIDPEAAAAAGVNRSVEPQ